MGSSISSRRERSRSTGVVVRPSTTIRSGLAASSGVAPCAMSSPARRLRPVGAQHVTIRSPMPASPANVSGRAPATSAKRPSPPGRVRRVRPFRCPRVRARPHHRRRAITSLAAAQSSTTWTTSSFTYTRKIVEWTATWRRTASLEVVARDHGRSQTTRDLLGDVRAREPQQGAPGRASKVARRSPGRGPW